MRFLPASVATDLLFTSHAARHDQLSKSAGKSGFKMCRSYGRTAHAGEVLIAKLTGARSRLKAVERSTRRGALEIWSDTFRPIYGISRPSANRQNRVVIERCTATVNNSLASPRFLSTHCPRSAAHALLPRASRTCTASVEAHIEDERIIVQTLKSKQRAIVLA